jgi:hypothetical protein
MGRPRVPRSRDPVLLVGDRQGAVLVSVERTITFDGHTGDIVIVSPGVTNVVTRGMVLLTPDQAEEAVGHGWKLFGGTEGEAELGLVRVRRK